MVALLAAGLLLQGCERKAGAPAPAGLTAEERAVEAPATGTISTTTHDSFAQAPDTTATADPPAELPPVDAKNAGPVLLDLMAETAYLNEHQQYVVDLLERDMAYLTIVLRNRDGAPVRGAELQYKISGSSRLVQIRENPLTDDSGWAEIGVTGGKMGSDKLTVSYKDRSLDIVLNVISLKAAGYAGFDESKGSLRWDALMKARLRFGADNKVAADFPTDITAQNGKIVKMIGFMMPLEPEQTQKHFLLTSNPPSCFFHIPGGPAGAVEVFASKGIAASWDPILLEGRFETVQGNELGVIYRLRDARVVSH